MTGAATSPPRLRLLHLEDNLDDAELIRLTLEAEWPDCRIERVDTQHDFVDALRRGGFDLILSDFSIPGFGGMNALALARRIRTGTPFVFLSGTIGEDNAVEALKKGATDYVIKDRLRRLTPVIRRALEEVGEHRLRQEAEQRLREQAELLDKARDAIYVRDFDDRVIYWNQSAERIFGYSAGEMQGLRGSDLKLFGRDPASFLEATRILLEQGEWKGEYRAVNKTKQEFDIMARWTLVDDEKGAPRSILCIDTDITEQRRLEKQVLRAQRLESVGLLAGGIAHDLNNVLTPVLMSVNMLRKLCPGREALRLLDMLETSAQHGAGLIQQVLAFSRGVEGDREPLQPRPIIDDVARLLGETLPRSIAMETDLPEDLWLVRSNSTQLSQVLMNLCVNARDAMPEGGRLSIRSRNVVVDEALAGSSPGGTPGRHVLVTVADTGTGIPAEVRERIFDPFFTTKASGKGTGLGLSTVLGIVKSHGGFLQVQSEVGRGSEFNLYFPAAAAAEEAGEPPASAAPARGKGETILVIEDEENVRGVVCEMLKSCGYGVVAAPGGAAGLEIYRQQAAGIHAVLTDMMMPEMQGPEVMRQLRALNPAVRIVAMSGLLDQGMVGIEEVPGRLEFVQKPMSGQTLMLALQRVLA